MANVDVTDLLSDPEFTDSMSIVHRVSTVDSYGQNSLAETTVVTIGSIQPISGKALQRLPEALRVANLRTFWVKGEIISDGTAQYPDILVFAGKRYQVQNTNDWTNFGGGWTEGTAVAEKPTG